jgi:hypothetical protein
MKTLSNCLVVTVLLAGAAWSGTGQGSWSGGAHATGSNAQFRGQSAGPARGAALEANVCDELVGATPGLYGLCVAYCQAGELPRAMAKANGKPDRLADLAEKKEAVLQRFNAARGAGDPEMPCIRQDACPCWSGEQTSSAFWLSRSRAPQCSFLDQAPLAVSTLSAGSITGGDSAMLMAYANHDLGIRMCYFTDTSTGTATLQQVSDRDARVCATQVSATCSLVAP